MNGYWGPFTQPPNLLILMTDQQRTAQHFPAGWVEQNLPNLWALQQGGVTFPNAMTNTTACSPARATLWTGTYPTVNGVLDVGGTLNMTDALTTLVLALANYAPEGVTYDVAYKGKWHLDPSFESELTLEQQQTDAARAKQLSDNETMQSTYGFPGWTSQDFGTDMAMERDHWRGGTVGVPAGIVNTLGAGGGGNDVRVAKGESYVTGGTVEGARQWLAAQAGGGAGNPFCLVVSLVNPHDVFVSPAGYDAAGYPRIESGPDAGKYPWQVAPFTEITELPESYGLTSDELANKPAMQVGFRWTLAHGSGEEATRRASALDYLRFYAYLETLSDALLGEVLSAMTAETAANTLVVRLADHGEMAMSQGGMIEKEHQAYDETLLVPMVFSHPGLPQGVECTGLAGLIDVLPTLAEVCGLSIPSGVRVQGTSLAPAILAGASGTTYGQLLFATDDAGVVIRALVDDARYAAKYVVSCAAPPSSGGWQCELYAFAYDAGSAEPWPSERCNRIPVDGLRDGTPASTRALQATWRAMHCALTDAMAATSTTPAGWPPPPPPPPPSAG